MSTTIRPLSELFELGPIQNLPNSLIIGHQAYSASRAESDPLPAYSPTYDPVYDPTDDPTGAPPAYSAVAASQSPLTSVMRFVRRVVHAMRFCGVRRSGRD
ncbi:hypothetical protein HWV62_26991 [Athelia sp. TMB]|nr:hypothetical protein HWV62_26991 [Athelia sp. TMB]